MVVTVERHVPMTIVLRVASHMGLQTCPVNLVVEVEMTTQLVPQLGVVS